MRAVFLCWQYDFLIIFLNPGTCTALPSLISTVAKPLKYIICLSAFLAFACFCKGQLFCADSSIRIKYLHPQAAFDNLDYNDNSGHNFFAGRYSIAPGIDMSGVLMKTGWGDSIYFAKRYFNPSVNFFLINAHKTPDHSIIAAGNTSTSYWGRDLIVIKTGATGELAWSKKIRLNQTFSFHSEYYTKIISPSFSFAGNNTYLSGSFSTSSRNYYTISRFDLNGNIIWSTSLGLNFPSNYQEISFYEHPLLIQEDTIITYCNKFYFNSSGQNDTSSVLLTKIDANTGAVLSGTEFFFTSSLGKVFFNAAFGRMISNGSLYLSGNGAVNPAINNPVMEPVSILIDNQLNVVSASFLKSNTPNHLLQPYDQDMNTRLQNSLLYTNDQSQQYNYFIVTDSVNNIEKTRKFFIPTTITNGTLKTVNIDDKENIHFSYRYTEDNKKVTEYARISDLDPGSTLQCFGQDTSLFTRMPLSVTQRSFTWPVVQQGVLISQPITLTEEDITVEKEKICWQVSRCDSVKIMGDTSVCATAFSLRYNIYKNPECLKKINWTIDTAGVTLLGTEADSAITISFKRTGLHTIKVMVDNCIVQDSIVINVKGAAPAVIISGDSVLCPGGAITLQAAPGYASYEWQDGSTSSSHTVSVAGWYKVIAYDSCNNRSADSMLLTVANSSLNIPSITELCLADTVRFTLPFTASSVHWQPSATGVLTGNHLKLFPTENTFYTINATLPPHCVVTKTVWVQIIPCPETVYVPSSFTPNNDGLNDSFKAIAGRPLELYKLTVYDRAGQKVFESKNQYNGWDGALKGTKQNSGVFAWQLTYKFRNKEAKYMKGIVILIR